MDFTDKFLQYKRIKTNYIIQVIPVNSVNFKHEH